jgi:hypothetical protein
MNLFDLSRQWLKETFGAVMIGVGHQRTTQTLDGSELVRIPHLIEMSLTKLNGPTTFQMWNDIFETLV